MSDLTTSVLLPPDETTVSVSVSEEQRATVSVIAGNTRPKPLARPTPASLITFGDSYLDPDGVGVEPADGIVQRLREAFGLGSGHLRNEAVAGSMIRSHFTGCSYAKVWEVLATKRAAGPFTADVAVMLGKWWTNDAIRGTTTTQEYGVKGALRSVVCRGIAGSVYQHDDPAVTADAGWDELLWADLAAEPHDVTAQDPDQPWGGGTGCLVSDTIGAEIDIAVPADADDGFDLYFVGSWYGGVASIAVNGDDHGTIDTGGCGIPWYGVNLYDERNGIVYRIPADDVSGGDTITITVDSVDVGSAGNPVTVRVLDRCHRPGCRHVLAVGARRRGRVQFG
jgi:hypothetical protein